MLHLQFDSDDDDDNFTLDVGLKYLTTKDAETTLNAIPEDHKRRMKKIWIANNQLDAVPEALLAWPHLTSLGLTNNRIEHLPDWIGNFTCLEELAVGDNKLEAIPRSVGNLVNLTSLHLQWNHLLTALPSSILKLTNLSTLYLNRTGLPSRFQTVCFDQRKTQKLLFEIAVLEWRKHAQHAAVTWILIASYAGLCSKDIARLIGKIICETHREEIWEEAASNQ